MNTKPEINPKFISFLRNTYSGIPRNESEKILEGIHTLFQFAQDPRKQLKVILDHSARLIYRLFEFKEVAIGLKDKKDRLYRYVTLLGYRKDSEDAYRKLVYNYEDMISMEKYPFTKIGKQSEYDFVEGLPEDEVELYTYNRPEHILKKKRESFEQFMEGDYIDVWIYGDKGELVGWLELANTKDGKLPPRTSIQWIELIANILGMIILRKNAPKA